MPYASLAQAPSGSWSSLFGILGSSAGTLSEDDTSASPPWWSHDTSTSSSTSSKPPKAITSHSAPAARREWAAALKATRMPTPRGRINSVDPGPPNDDALSEIAAFSGRCLGARKPWTPGMEEPMAALAPPTPFLQMMPKPTVDPLPSARALRQPVLASRAAPPVSTFKLDKRELDSIVRTVREAVDGVTDTDDVDDDPPPASYKSLRSGGGGGGTPATTALLDATASSARRRVEQALARRVQTGPRRRRLLESADSARARGGGLKSQCEAREKKATYPGPLSVHMRNSNDEPTVLSKAARMVASCLLHGDVPLPPDLPACTYDTEQTQRELRNLLTNLTSYRKLRMERPICHTVTRGARCSTLSGNVQSGVPTGTWRREDRPPADLPAYKWRTCAIVANGPLSKVERNGKMIDAHDAVWRFNLMPASFASGFVGSRTSVRVFNRLRGYEATGKREGRGQSMKAKPGETWMFWHSRSVAYLSDVKEKHGRARVDFLHSSHIAWMASAYFEARKDVMQILSPFGWQRPSCPDQMSSGVQAILTALKLCGRVNLFGFSYSRRVLANRPGHSDGPHSMHTAHSWDFDVVLVRLLKLMGLIDVCTADDPTVTTKELQMRGKARGRTSLTY